MSSAAPPGRWPVQLEIAADIQLGVETVRTHVRNILAKLGFRDRVQAVIAAYESGFVSLHAGD